MAMKAFNLDSEMPAFYGSGKATFRQLVESGEGTIKKERSLIGKENYYFYMKPKSENKSSFGYLVNGKQARKYINKDSTGHLKDF